MRAEHFDEAFFTRKIDFKEKFMGKFAEKAALPDTSAEQRASLRYNVFRFDLEQLLQRYSRGDEVAPLRKQFPRVVAEYAEHRRDPKAEKVDFAKIDQYWQALCLVSLGILFAVDDATWKSILASTDNEGHDALFERLVATRTKGRKAASAAVHKAYQPLVTALDAKGEARSLQIQKFLAGWYKGMKNVYWHDAHTIKDSPYFGYWCVELAAAVKALGIDDAPFADHPHYPRDLVR